MTETPSVPASAARPSEERQRRGSRRAPLEASVRMVQPRRAEGATINASEGGLRVALDEPLHPEEICVLVVSEPGAPNQLVRARVAWSRILDDGCIAGLQRLGLH